MITVSNSNLPANIRKESNHFETSGKNEKLSIGPTKFNPGPTPLIAVTTAPIELIKSNPKTVSKRTDVANMTI